MIQHPQQWLQVRAAGLYCVPGDFYIDPLKPVSRALITHAHSDHAISGHQKIWASSETIAIMRTRYGESCCEQMCTIKYGDENAFELNEVQISFHPAGHIIGSAQIKLNYQQSTIVISGDYKRSLDPTCAPFVVQPCDVFLTEATFAMPVFQHAPIERELGKLLASLQQYPNRCHLIGAYALGKCQRMIIALRKLGYDKPIYLHGAMQRMCELYESFGMDLGELIPVTHENAPHLAGELVFCPPSALNDRWTRRFPNVLRAFASGWMQIRARAKQKGIELPLVVSDHADWNELIQTIKDVNAKEIWITHGTDEALMYYAEQQGIKARALTLHYDEEDD